MRLEPAGAQPLDIIDTTADRHAVAAARELEEDEDERGELGRHVRCPAIGPSDS